MRRFYIESDMTWLLYIKTILTVERKMDGGGGGTVQEWNQLEWLRSSCRSEGPNVQPGWECTWRKWAAFSYISGVKLTGAASRFDVKRKAGSGNYIYGLMHILHYETFVREYLANVWSIRHFLVLSDDGSPSPIWPLSILLFQSPSPSSWREPELTSESYPLCLV